MGGGEGKESVRLGARCTSPGGGGLTGEKTRMGGGGGDGGAGRSISLGWRCRKEHPR